MVANRRWLDRGVPARVKGGSKEKAGTVGEGVYDRSIPRCISVHIIG